jgi:tryptophanyl-tRNA synthetase
MDNLKVSSSNSKRTVDQLVTPWDVKGEVIDGVEVGINYDKLMTQFGCAPLSAELVARFEKLTGEAPHVLLRRGMFYCHREFEKILDLFEAKKPFYLYTGRGPSSESMHLGHMVPFVFCQYSQLYCLR